MPVKKRGRSKAKRVYDSVWDARMNDGIYKTGASGADSAFGMTWTEDERRPKPPQQQQQQGFPRPANPPLYYFENPVAWQFAGEDNVPGRAAHYAALEAQAQAQAE